MNQDILKYLDPYQKKFDITSYDIAKRIHFSGQIPSTILMISPCRSGSTSYLRVFSASGIESHYQPIKAILRSLMQNGEWEFCVPDRCDLFIKETLGPYTRLESTLEPLKILLEAGYPVDKIRIICLARDPLSTLASWLNMFSHNREKTTLFKNFILAYKSIQQLQEDAQALGISVYCYVHEAIRDNNPSLVIRTLFEKLGITFTPQAIGGWQSLPQFGSPESRVIFSMEPLIYWGNEFHLSITNAQALQYIPKNRKIPEDLICFNWQETMLENKIWDIYNNIREECIKWLDLPIEEAKAP